MAITYPLSPPSSPGYVARDYAPQTRVGIHASPYTLAQQVYAWPGQANVFEFELPPMTDAEAGEWVAFFLALNGPEGTMLLVDPVRVNPRGNVGGTWTVGSGAVANTTTLPLAGGTGIAAKGDWIEVQASTTAPRLHRVTNVSLSAGIMISVDVFPRLRAAYSSGVTVSFTAARGLFRLAELPNEAFDRDSLARGIAFRAVEAL